MKRIILVILTLFSFRFSYELHAQTHRAKIITNYGTIVIELYDGTPKHRDNFIKLANQNYFDSLLFHRVIKGFVVQAGDPTSKNANDTAQLGEGDLGYTVPAEIFPERYFHKRGTVGMARDENPEKASSACQFYIVQGKIANDSTFIKARARTNGYEISEEHKQVYRTIGGIPHLDSRYTVFGEVMKGMEVVDKIALVETDKNDRPKKEVRIKKVKMLN
ncbi:MAG: peptidylprolyl isomerase [Bacteroidetes bacterium]|nr:peptidylprolyl isomerase [Bacteroidota bacterium]